MSIGAWIRLMELFIVLWLRSRYSEFYTSCSLVWSSRYWSYLAETEYLFSIAELIHHIDDSCYSIWMHLIPLCRDEIRTDNVIFYRESVECHIGCHCHRTKIPDDTYEIERWTNSVLLDDTSNDDFFIFWGWLDFCLYLLLFFLERTDASLGKKLHTIENYRSYEYKNKKSNREIPHTVALYENSWFLHVCLLHNIELLLGYEHLG